MTFLLHWAGSTIALAGEHDPSQLLISKRSSPLSPVALSRIRVYPANADGGLLQQVPEGGAG